MPQIWSPNDLDSIPRMGWLREPSPVTPLPETARSLGLSYLGVKRDDQVEALYGGTKPRKLDYVLALPEFANAPGWVHAAGIGSGNMVALTAAAIQMKRRLDANVFWTPTSPEILENLAFIASGPTDLHYYGSRLALLRRPSLLVSAKSNGMPVIPPGSTSPDGMIGLVRAGLELGEQVRAGTLPEPDRIYLSLGSGGTAVGLAMGIAMAGLKTSIVAVSAVEWLLSLPMRMRSLQQALRARLERAGFSDLPEPAAIRIDRRFLGPGYSESTSEGLAACAAMKIEGIGLETAYTGKAMAALLADGREGKGKGAVLFWQTCRRGPLPTNPDYVSRLPKALVRRLVIPDGRARISRRRVVAALGAGAAAAGIGIRLSGYPPLPGWAGSILAPWEAWVVTAAAEAILPPAPDGGAFAPIAARIDRFLLGMPPKMLRDIHAMLALIEHGTPLGGRISRFTHLSREDRIAFLDSLESHGGLLAQAATGVRDLCLLAYYGQQPAWTGIGYEGPRVSMTYNPKGPERIEWPAYDSLVAPPGTQPLACADEKMRSR